MVDSIASPIGCLTTFAGLDRAERRDSSVRALARHTAGTSRTASEDPYLWNATAAAQLNQHRCRVVAVVELAQPPVGIHAGRKPKRHRQHPPDQHLAAAMSESHAADAMASSGVLPDAPGLPAPAHLAPDGCHGDQGEHGQEAQPARNLLEDGRR